MPQTEAPRTAIVRSSDGTEIAFDRYGSGPALILVGGAFQHRALDTTTAALARLLAPQLTVFHYDRRGRGDSGDTAPYAVEREIEDLDALIAEAGGSAFVHGISSGAALALEAAAHGSAITRLALYEPPYGAGEPEPAPEIELGTRISELVAAGRRGDAVAAFMAVTGAPPAAIEQMRQAPFWALLESVAHTLPYDIAVMGDGELPTARVAGVDVPTLALAGGDSGAWAEAAARSIAAALPDVRRRTLAGQTHEVAPEALAPALLEFLVG